jgi:sporulation protein YlmC with PRC-barrel domain
MLVGPELLERPIVDLAGASIGTVDDVELSVGDGGVPQITALLVEPRHRGARPGGRLGRLLGGRPARPFPVDGAGKIRIPWDLVAFCDNTITLSVRRERLNQPTLEQWLHDQRRRVAVARNAHLGRAEAGQ